ncbi:deoxyribodipyrimidine photo-lyase [Piptocephalis cylindrospora]|uniref:Deoxyribodipyrimidine photo-lyase n=1 Tax=Piptocephalis cylindrospora TaxID=1907219 RepID=A0A4P9Y3B6_9FUNG|nr:deoxyribodipyrimidine photo-lyase [Piptocephalis cylindrospora]|eukprot:RKP13396.1 deoxyribodipyrimidine photo-lyase [Piptocephalis cylindrospora]
MSTRGKRSESTQTSTDPPRSKGAKRVKEDEANRTLVWFRRDFRLHDHMALARASASTPASQSHLLALYLISPEEWIDHDEAPIKVDFWLRALPILRKDFAALHIPLIIRTLDRAKGQHADVILDVCKQYRISAVHWNREYEVDELARDASVQQLLQTHDRQVYQHHDQCIVPPGQVLTKAGTTSKVYSSFRNSWYTVVARNPSLLKESRFPRANEPSALRELHEAFEDGHIPESLDQFPLAESARERARRDFPVGEEEAKKRLHAFIQKKMGMYGENRSSLALQGTSILSPYLHSGMVSARSCIREAKEANGNRLEGGMAGAVNWMAEVVWRDFFRHILVAHPKVSRNQPFKAEFTRFPWASDSGDRSFQAWTQGRTGYPIVDASMRCLNTTGWLHNRSRMVVASFLCKDLLVDWRKGERYFMQHLLDGDLASNNGNWQWVAASGTDSQPFFRIFNPARQSQRFDPDGAFIREWVKELRDCPKEDIHAPSASIAQRLKYPEPIVDHSKARDRALKAFQQMRSAS